MNENQNTLDRLEARIEDQTARIDALYRLLELRGILPRATDACRGDALFDDESEGLDLSGWAAKPRPTRRRSTRLHVGTATGV
ncbi:MAG: hypothetical protein ACXVRV_01745 [Gaiellaceae bacterium]